MHAEKHHSLETTRAVAELKPLRMIRLETDYDGPDYHFEQREKEEMVFVFDLPSKFKKKYAELLSDLPEGAAIIGGAARSAARYLVTGDDEPVRDVDLVSLVDDAGEPIVDDDRCWELSRKYMPDDAEQGHAMSSCTLESCFLERDLTANQCAIVDGQLLMSEAAIHDFESDVICPSTYELDWDFGGNEEIKSRLALRMITMKSTLEHRTGREFMLAGYNPRSIFSFDIAVSLNKMMSRGRAEADSFCAQLSLLNVVPGDFSGDPVGLASWLLRTRAVVDFEFRNNKNAEFAYEDDSYISAIRALRRYSASSKDIRDAASEYDDYPDSKYFSSEEYEEINRNAYLVCYDEEEYEYSEDDEEEYEYSEDDD